MDATADKMTKALLVRARERTVVAIDWDISDVPHVDMRHDNGFFKTLRFMLGCDENTTTNSMRAISYIEGCDSRNHVLASRVLHGRDDRVLGTGAYTVRMKGDERWLAWVRDDVDRAAEQDGFIVKFPNRTPTRVPFFGDGIVVLYRPGAATYASSTMSTAEAERVMAQPVAFDPARVEIEWIRGVPAQIQKHPIANARVYDLSSGPIIFQCCPPPSICSGCGDQFVRVSRCAGCREACYCSKGCQLNDWPRHKAACRAKRAKAVESV